MRDFLKKNSGRSRRRAGDSFATLLFAVGAIAFAAGTFALTEALLGQVDTTSVYVPMKAKAYVHANGHAAAEALLSSTNELPSGLHPYEFASFSSEGDDAPQHGTILAWQRLRKPTAAEQAILSERGATQLDTTHFFFGDASLATASKVSAAAHSSLADDPVRSKALGFARARFSIQAIVSPRELLSGVPSPVVSEHLRDVTPETAVMGASLREHSFIAQIIPLSSLSSAATASLPERGYIDTNRVIADLVLTEPSPTVNVASFFSFGTADEHFVTQHMIDVAEDGIRSVADSPYGLWIWKGTEESPRTDFIFHFPAVKPTDMANALIRSFAVHNPATEPIVLPDGDTANELRVQLPFIAQEGDIRDVVIGSDDGRIVVGSDGSRGTLISSDANIMAEYRAPMPSVAPVDPCGRLGARMTVHNMSLLSNEIEVIRLLSEKLDLNSLTFGMGGGNTLDICGYKR